MFDFPVDVSDLFAERSGQMKSWGLPSSVIKRVRGKISDAWSDSSGGWAPEWIKEAERAKKNNQKLVAALCYGAARFPCAATPLRKLAQERQIQTYIEASKSFPCFFSREILKVTYRDSVITVPVHLFSRRSAQGRDRPIVCLSGGVDTYKVELHRLALALALIGDFIVVAIDMPGTGESSIPLAQDAEQIYLGVTEQLQKRMTIRQKTAAIGISFGGHWSAKMGLKGIVDAAVDVGGPVGAIPMTVSFVRNLPNGMTGIVCNAIGLSEIPFDEKIAELLKIFSLREQGLLEVTHPAPMLVVNGENDPYIPEEETLVFERYPTATVMRVRETTHCAAEKFLRIMPTIVAWLRERLHGESVPTSILSVVAKATLPQTVRSTHV